MTILNILKYVTIDNTGIEASKIRHVDSIYSSYMYILFTSYTLRHTHTHTHILEAKTCLQS